MLVLVLLLALSDPLFWFSSQRNVLCPDVARGSQITPGDVTLLLESAKSESVRAPSELLLSNDDNEVYWSSSYQRRWESAVYPAADRWVSEINQLSVVPSPRQRQRHEVNPAGLKVTVQKHGEKTTRFSITLSCSFGFTSSRLKGEQMRFCIPFI